MSNEKMRAEFEAVAKTAGIYVADFARYDDESAAHHNKNFGDLKKVSPGDYVANSAQDSWMVWQAARAQAACQHCDSTGDVHSPDGEWRGVCTCEAGQAINAQPAVKESLTVAQPTAEQSSVVAQPHTPPFSNCKFDLCDLPGQCRSEGKCHHPAQPAGEAVAVIGSGFQLLYCRKDWSDGLRVGDLLYTAPQPKGGE